MDPRKMIIEQIKQIEIQEETGSLYLLCDKTTAGDPMKEKEIVRVYFEKGLISAMSSSGPDGRCGQRFLKEGLIGPPELHRLLRATKPMGEALVDLGLADPVKVRSLLYDQALDIFRHALGAGYQVQSFRNEAVHFRIPLAIGLDTLLLEEARTNDRNGIPFGPNRRISLLAGRDFSTLPWRPEEIAILDELCESKTFDELLDTTRMTRERLLSTLHTFHQLAIIDLVEDAAEGETAALTARRRFPLEALVPKAGSQLMSEQIETSRNEHSFISEQFAFLKVRLKGALSTIASRVIAVTSPYIEDGKSLVATNLAFSFARDPGRRTVLLDLDLRNPSVDRYIGIPLEPGVIGYLGDSLTKPYCFMRRVGELFVLTAGGTAENPVELLSLKKTGELVEYLKTEFDTVIVDTPPLSPISDTHIISRLVDSVVFVIRQGRTPFPLTQKAIESIDRKKILGVVFNEVRPLWFRAYHDYSYYGYGKDGRYDKSGSRPYRRR